MKQNGQINKQSIICLQAVKETGGDESKEKCKNKMLQCISNMKNLGENCSDFIDFENQFNDWDYDLIILDELNIVDDMENKEDNYVYLKTLGIYNNIGMFARKLQRLLSGKNEYSISVIMIGDDLHIDIQRYSGNDIHILARYIAKCGKMNQIEGYFGTEGYKFGL